MWDALMIGTGLVAGVAGTVALAVRWYERPQDWCGGTDGGVYLAGYQHGRRDGATATEAWWIAHLERTQVPEKHVSFYAGKR